MGRRKERVDGSAAKFRTRNSGRLLRANQNKSWRRLGCLSVASRFRRLSWRHVLKISVDQLPTCAESKSVRQVLIWCRNCKQSRDQYCKMRNEHSPNEAKRGTLAAALAVSLQLQSQVWRRSTHKPHEQLGGLMNLRKLFGRW